MTLYGCFPRSLHRFPFQAFLSMTYTAILNDDDDDEYACSVTVVIFGHLNRFYVLSFLLTQVNLAWPSLRG